MKLTLSQAERAIGRPSAVRADVRAALRVDELYLKLDDYLQPPGVCGSKAYDQAIAAQIVFDWDKKHNNGRIASHGLNHRQLWVHIYAVLGGVFLTSHGRVIGLLENKPANPSEAEAAAAEEAATPASGGDIQ
jgi:hypothetical protein